MANQTSKRGAEIGNQRAAKEDPRGAQIFARVTADEKGRLEAAAAAEGLKLSAWVRKKCGLTP